MEKLSNRIGEIRLNNQGQPMKIIEYTNAKNIIVEFQDMHKAKTKTTYNSFVRGCITNPYDKQRLGEIKLSNDNCLMKIIEYNKANDIVVEFQDDYKAKVHTQYSNFKTGNVRNPFSKSVYGIGVVGDKYEVQQSNGKRTREYAAWRNILKRSFNKEYKEKHPTYQNVTCCNDWLYYPNFYEWLHSQPNFEKWHENKKWSVDKDILIKGNKLYSPETCCLVPQNINALFTKRDNCRGNCPIGVTYNKKSKRYWAQCENQLTNENSYIGAYDTELKAFEAYKNKKEYIIKQVAEVEFAKGNITKKCYEAMMNYIVEITD